MILITTLCVVVPFVTLRVTLRRRSGRSPL
ncbi:hypothetical protein GSU75_02554 [Pseudomonas savastanoi pv. phaseolicola]|nr:hypothetical protein [Pseudomonas savastanoi pv. phaseolicola]